MTPFFSIIMAAYNVENYIMEAIDSIISQTFKDWELIIINDASTDHTAEIIEKFVHFPQIKTLTLKQNSGGVFVPREKGTEIAEGKYIVHFDSDDILATHHLQKLYDKISETGADLVIPQLWRFKDSIEEAYKILPKENFELKQIREGRDLVKLTILNWQIPMAGYAVRKEIFINSMKNVSQLTSQANLADEIQSRLLLYYSKKCAFVDSQYFYRITPNSITNNKFGEVERLNCVNFNLIQFAEDFFGHTSEEYRLAKINFYFFLLTLYSVVDTPGFTSEQRNSIKELFLGQKQKLGLEYYKDKIGRHYYYCMKLPYSLGKVLYKTVCSLRKLIKSR